ncbi:MAG: hypothetical protein ACRCTP_04150 [Aeromonas popoffii]|uniref:hypothetical protein n=1 Tax=Aeromonas popoffii TaxID=70856 RepID=UPI003F32DB46
MKSPFTDFVIQHHKLGATVEEITDEAQVKFRDRGVRTIHVERIIENFSKGRIADGGKDDVQQPSS